MNHSEDISKIEQGNERIPPREDVVAQIRKCCEGAQVFRELSDERGLYLLEAGEPGESSGESTHYEYHRVGTFGKNSYAVTLIEKIYFVDNIPRGGDIIAEYDHGTGEWIEV